MLFDLWLKQKGALQSTVMHKTQKGATLSAAPFWVL
jgi:hypothetical protein